MQSAMAAWREMKMSIRFPGGFLSGLQAFLLALVLALFFAAGAAAQQEEGPPAVSGADAETLTNPPLELPAVLALRVSSTPERARFVVDLGGVTSFAFVSLKDPDRIAIDVRALGYDGPPRGEAAGGGLIGDFSVEQVGADRLRTTLVLSEPAQVQQAYVLEAHGDQPARLVVDIIGASQEEFDAIAQRDLAASMPRSGEEATLEHGSDAPGASQIPVATRPLILIDPGHGGVDGGARTEHGVEEKDITLEFARQLRDVLIASGRFDVALTREGDSFLRLEERVQLARENKADLFISIHADTFDDPAIRGASVYIRDEQATDVLDKVLAENENKVDLLAGFPLPEGEPEVVNILVDLMRREMRRQSFLAARAIVEQMRPSIRVRRFPLRRADFFVLQSPDVPSVLLELGFLSNGDDARNLDSPQWRERVAEAVARGISSYIDMGQ